MTSKILILDIWPEGQDSLTKNLARWAGLLYVKHGMTGKILLRIFGVTGKILLKKLSYQTESFTKNLTRRAVFYYEKYRTKDEIVLRWIYWYWQDSFILNLARRVWLFQVWGHIDTDEIVSVNRDLLIVLTHNVSREHSICDELERRHFTLK